MEWQPNFRPLFAPLSYSRPIDAKSERYVWRELNFSASDLAPFHHLHDDQEKKRLVRCRISSRTVNPQGGKFL